MTQPQLIISLTPDRAGLQAELPGLNGSRRVVRLSAKGFHADCMRMLLATAEQQCEIGLDGAPTQAQIKHWENHGPDHPSDICKFCLAEGWTHRSKKRPSKREVTQGDGSVKVRRLPAKGKAQPQARQLGRRISASLEELGL